MNILSFFIGAAVGGLFGVFTMTIFACSKDKFSDSDERECADEVKSENAE